jgi:hypothetical protein
MKKINSEQLAQLLAKIERAWIDTGERTLVYQLASAYPECSRELHEFFEDLVLDRSARKDEDEFVTAEDNLANWLSASGFDIALSSAASANSATSTTTSGEGLSDDQRVEISKATNDVKSTWVMFLRNRTKKTLPDIVQRLGNVTTEYLILVSRHPQVVPQKAKECIAEKVERVWGISAQDSFHYFAERSHAVRAASRSRPFEQEPRTFEELLSRSALTKEQMLYWLQLNK